MRLARASHLDCRKRYTKPLSFAAISGYGHYVYVSPRIAGDAERWLEGCMPVSRKEARGGRAFAAPLFGVALLIAFYWLLTDWQNVPDIISSALAVIHWPG